jgi:integrase
MLQKVIVQYSAHCDDVADGLRHAEDMLQPYAEVFELWQKAPSIRRQTTIDGYWKTWRHFAQDTGFKPLAEITRKEVIDYRDRLLEAGQSANTAKQKVGVVRSMLMVALDYELIKVNPADKVRTAVKVTRKQRVAFSCDDLNRIFSSAIFTEGLRPLGGGREAAYWLPLLALFTGARVEELAQLLVADVIYVEGLGHYLNVTDEAEHAQLKNAASRRRIPVHRELVACGFIDYVAQQKKGKLLFPHLKPNPRNKLGGYFSYYFSQYLRQRIGITDPRKVFHSFRHTFKDACRSVGIEESVHDALTGHTNTSAGRKYGNEQYPLEPLFEAMERYEVLGANLSHLYKKDVAPTLNAAEIKLISSYYGVTIAFTDMRSKQVRPPFIVALHDGASAGFDVFENKVIFGELPTPKKMLVNAWIEIHREALVANWNAGRMTGQFFALDPLR